MEVRGMEFRESYDNAMKLSRKAIAKQIPGNNVAVSPMVLIQCLPKPTKTVRKVEERQKK